MNHGQEEHAEEVAAALEQQQQQEQAAAAHQHVFVPNGNPAPPMPFMAAAGVAGGFGAVGAPHGAHFHGITGGSDTTQWADSLRRHVSPTLWDLLLRPTQDFESEDPSVRGAFWSTVADRLNSHPQDAAVDLYRLYPLHRALMNSAPPEVIRAMVAAYPAAVSTPNYNDDYPLHIACINEHPPFVLRLLLSSHPDALHHRAEGLLPLHWCAEWWRNSTSSFDLIYREGRHYGVGGGRGLGGLLCEDREGNTPVDYMCDDAASKRGWTEEQWGWLRGVLCEAGRETAIATAGMMGSARAGAAVALNGDKNVGMPLHDDDDEAANEAEVNAGMPVLHAALQLSTSEAFIRLLLELYPDQIAQRDFLGRPPLAVAAFNRKVNGAILELLLKHERGDADDEESNGGGGNNGANNSSSSGGGGGGSNRRLSRRAHARGSFRALFSPKHPNNVGAPASRNASMSDRSGLLPLHHAALSGRAFEDGVGAVLKAAPQALHTRDRRNGMYPFMLAALATTSSSAGGESCCPISPSSMAPGCGGGRMGTGFGGSLPNSRRSSRANMSGEDSDTDSSSEDDGMSVEGGSDSEDEDNNHQGGTGRFGPKKSRGSKTDDPALSSVDAAFGLLRADPSLIQSAVIAASAEQDRKPAAAVLSPKSRPAAAMGRGMRRSTSLGKRLSHTMMEEPATKSPGPNRRRRAPSIDEGEESTMATGLGLRKEGPLGKRLSDIIKED